MSEEQQTFYKKLADVAIRNFGRRHIKAQYIPHKEEAATEILDMIPEGVTVGAGDSETLVQIGIFPALRKRGKNKIINPLKRNDEGNLDGGWEEINEMMRKVLLTDVYLSGTNAITLDGKVVNTDGGGNRVAPMIFGPRKVIIVAGVNKIVKDVDEAMKRIKGFCAPINALRHVIQHNDEEFMELPCARTGICSDCRKSQRICNFTSIIEGESHRSAGRMNIIIIGEHLGI